MVYCYAELTASYHLKIQPNPPAYCYHPAAMSTPNIAIYFYYYSDTHLLPKYIYHSGCHNKHTTVVVMMELTLTNLCLLHFSDDLLYVNS